MSYPPTPPGGPIQTCRGESRVWQQTGEGQIWLQFGYTPQGVPVNKGFQKAQGIDNPMFQQKLDFSDANEKQTK